MRKILLANLLMLLFAGCAAPAFDDQALDVPRPDVVSPHTVSIREDIDLLQGLPETTWEWRIEPGATVATVSARVVPYDGDAIITRSYCFTLVANEHDGSILHQKQQCQGGSPASSSIEIAGSGQAHRELYQDDGAAPGLWRIAFDADPTPARFVLEVSAIY